MKPNRYGVNDTEIYTVWGGHAMIKRQGYKGKVSIAGLCDDALLVVGDEVAKLAKGMDSATSKAQAISLFDVRLLTEMLAQFPEAGLVTIGLMSVPETPGRPALLMTNGKEEVVLMPMRGDLQIEPEFMDVPLLGQTVTAGDIIEELRRVLPKDVCDDFSMSLAAAAGAIVAMIKGESAND